MNKLMRLLAIMGALTCGKIVIAETEGKTNHVPHASITMDARTEAQNDDYAEADVLLTPKVIEKVGDTEVKYSGTFRKLTNTDGETKDLQTITHNVKVNNGAWNLALGRTGFRTFGDTTATVDFDNAMAGKGLTRIFTGAFVGYEPTGLTVGIASSDTEMSLRHWDMLMASWSHHFSDSLGFQVHAAATEDAVEKAGLALECKPTDNIRLLADSVYSKTGTTVMLGANVGLTEKLKLFAAAEITKPEEGETMSRVLTGVEGNLGNGFKAIGAVEQGISSDGSTKAIFGLKFNGSRDLL